MKYNFTVRVHADEDRSSGGLSDIRYIDISGIVLISKPEKFGGVCFHKGNQKKHKYTMNLSKNFAYVAGSINYPILWINKGFIDIVVKNFPRKPELNLNEYQLKYRKIEIINQ